MGTIIVSLITNFSEFLETSFIYIYIKQIYQFVAESINILRSHVIRNNFDGDVVVNLVVFS